MINFIRKFRKKGILTLLLMLFVFSLMMGSFQVNNNYNQEINDLNEPQTLQTLATSYSFDWNKSYAISNNEDDSISDMFIDTDGTIYSAGEVNITSREYYIGKLDTNGNLLKNVTWGGTGYDHGYQVALDSQKNVYVIGFINNGIDSDVGLVKYDSDLNYVWNVTLDSGFGGDQGLGIAIDTDDNDYIYITGFFETAAAGQDVFVRKYDTNKNLQWERTWGTNAGDQGTDLALYRSGSNTYIYVAGQTTMAGLSVQGFLFKLRDDNSIAPTANNISWGGSSNDWITKVGVDGAGNIYAMGNTQSFDFGGGDVFITKYDPDMVSLWNRTWGGLNSDNPNGFFVNGAGEMVISGSTTTYGAGSYDVFIISYDSNGYQTWETIWGESGSDRGNAVYIFGNSVYLFGNSESFTPHKDILILKYTLQGGSSPIPSLFTTEFFIGLVIGAGIGIAIICVALLAISRRNKLPDTSIETTKPKLKTTSIKKK